MENKETLQQVVDATLEQPVEITVDVMPQSVWQQKLQHWGLLPTKRVFQLKPIYLGSLMKISKRLLSIHFRLPGAEEEKSDATLLNLNYEAIEKHTTQLAEIIVIAIQNTDKEPDTKLVRFVLQNFTTKEMYGVLLQVLNQMDLTNFMRSIISIRGMNVVANRNPAPATPVNGNGVSL